MGELFKHAEASVLQGVMELNLAMETTLHGDNGIARIAAALQTNTTVRKLDVINCGISDVGAESLQVLNISDNKIGDDDITHIVTALQTNNTLKRLSLGNFNTTTMTDEGIISLVLSVITTDCSIRYLLMEWSSLQPGNVLEVIGECVRESELQSHIYMPQPSGEATAERAIEWLQCLEVGGSRLMHSLEDSSLTTLYLYCYYLSPHEICTHEKSVQELRTR